MLRFLGKRLLQLIPTLLIISMLIFIVLDFMPGDPVQAYLGQGSEVSPERQEQIREQLGLDRPLPIQYFNWLGRVLTGDLGRTNIYNADVSEVIFGFIWNSFLLNIFALIFALLIAIPVGIKSAVKKYGLFDNFFTVFSLTGVSMPTFFFALILIFLFARNIEWIPLNGMRTSIMAVRGYDSLWQNIVDVGRHMLLPVLVLTMTSLATLTRYTRNSVIEVINQDYIRTARSKGLKEKVVIYKHAFRNALLPLITILGMWVPALFGGAILLETVFLWPGIGRVLLNGITSQDLSLVMATLVFYALLRVIGNLLADVSYGLADPRVRVK
ncbi:ABC transporter permease [Isachenkonia alkalipeptolytica]|uniref:ABC transporter permease n=1 Tax=Isachenkonia alkalipeptolytica TaxID=2565777 RepID=A0AA43XIG0_9CLOT|nr:ABC transporter permease [Isachenkonia alkalipeptolytica]NBG87445.1 ABC transporter permease [Isachenkonia alkalipeptolytica]